MRLRRSIPVVAAAAALLSPLAAFALPTVTTVPVVLPAPALALPVLVALAIALIGVGVYCLRTRSGRAVVGLALAAGLSVLAGLSYATIAVLIQGADCNMEVVNTFSVGGSPLTSACPNPIRIVAITCDAVPDVSAPTMQPCTIGKILLNGQSCALSCAG